MRREVLIFTNGKFAPKVVQNVAGKDRQSGKSVGQLPVMHQNVLERVWTWRGCNFYNLDDRLHLQSYCQLHDP